MSKVKPVELIRFPFFKTPITSLELGKSFLKQIVINDICFHLEDPPHDIIKHQPGKKTARLFTDQECIYLNQRVKELYSLDWENDECPIGYLLTLLNDTEGSQQDSSISTAPPIIAVDYSPGLTVHIRSFDVLQSLGQLLAESNISSKEDFVIIEGACLTDENIKAALCNLLDVSMTGVFVITALESPFIQFKYTNQASA